MTVAMNDRTAGLQVRLSDTTVVLTQGGHVRIPATRLAVLRKDRGMTQADLARRLGLSPSSVSAVENQHTRPWPRFRRECSKIFGVPESELFPEVGLRREA